MPALAMTRTFSYRSDDDASSVDRHPDREEASMPLPRLEASDVADRLTVMRRQEETTYRCDDYLENRRPAAGDASPSSSVSVPPASAKPVDAECRVKMCEWCYQVTDFCKFKRETVGIGMTYLDRYLATPSGRTALSNRKQYQLVAMTSLYVAIKLYEPLEMETSLLSELSRGCYTETEISETESSILESLRWRVHGPTPLGFVLHFFALLPESVAVSVRTALEDFARYQTELAVAEYAFVTKNPSTIAMASLLNAVDAIGTEHLSEDDRREFLNAVSAALGDDGPSAMVSPEVTEVRSHLRLLFARSSGGCDLRDVAASYRLEGFGSGSGVGTKPKKLISRTDRSPVCVSRKRD